MILWNEVYYQEKMKQNKNKYCGGTSDATTPLSFTVVLFMTSVDHFSPSETAIVVIQKYLGMDYVSL